MLKCSGLSKSKKLILSGEVSNTWGGARGDGWVNG